MTPHPPLRGTFPSRGRLWQQLDEVEFEELSVTERYSGSTIIAQAGNELSAATRRLDKLEFEEWVVGSCDNGAAESFG